MAAGCAEADGLGELFLIRPGFGNHRPLLVCVLSDRAGAAERRARSESLKWSTLDASSSPAHFGTPSACGLMCLPVVKTLLRRPDVAVPPREPAIDPVFADPTSTEAHCCRQAGQLPIDLSRSVT
jgi:hypothetical protein